MGIIFLLILFFIVFILACCKVSGDISKEEERNKELGVVKDETISIVSSKMAIVDTDTSSSIASIERK